MNIDSEHNYSPPIISESLKTIKYKKTKKQNGWSPIKLGSPDKNVKGNVIYFNLIKI